MATQRLSYLPERARDLLDVGDGVVESAGEEELGDAVEAAAEIGRHGFGK